MGVKLPRIPTLGDRLMDVVREVAPAVGRVMAAAVVMVAVVITFWLLFAV